MQVFFEKEITKLQNQIAKLFDLVYLQIEKIILALFSEEDNDFDVIRQNENKIDKIDVKIDKLCQKIFALAQPVATDLRFLMSSLKINNELERIGDIAFNIIHRAEIVKQMPEMLLKLKFDEYVQIILSMYKNVHLSYQNQDSEQAKEIVLQGKQLKEKSQAILNEIISQMIAKTEVLIIATDLILILREMERIVGHIENIAESIVFVTEGKIIRHPKLKDAENLDDED